MVLRSISWPILGGPLVRVGNLTPLEANLSARCRRLSRQLPVLVKSAGLITSEVSFAAGAVMGLSASRTLDDQRRRRLVMDADFGGPVRESARSTRIDPADALSNSDSAAGRLMISLSDCIPAQSWKYWVVGGIVLVTAMAMLIAALFAEEASAAGSVAGDKLAQSVETLIRGAGVLTWWLASQLSCLVWWVRSRSRVDYSGRFHAWGWAAAGFAVAGAMSLANLPQLATCLLTVLGDPPANETVVVTAIWLLPSLVVGLALWSTLGQELRGCTASRVLHSLSAVCGLAFVGLELWLARTDGMLFIPVASMASLMLMQWCNLMTVVLYVRYSVHISSDPSETTPSLWLFVWRRGLVRVLTWLRTSLSRVFVRRRSAAAHSDVVDSSHESETGQATDSDSGGDRKKRRVRLEVADGSTQDVRIDDAEQLAKGPSRRMKQSASRKS
jgi:hypothetical protein